ncbi:unnamed protein product [Thlaspi arvense]|uniref:Terpene synthase metal-binding domain-containing protein n=1 Tax=Thlaspi arvense TaxID=13288 RepID=A0AAU9S4T9_THLAR|nr:unnamed protein product [Thlaspi arvense]
MVEARWFYGAYTPTLEEYLENAWISVGGHAAMVHACLLLGSDVDKLAFLIASRLAGKSFTGLLSLPV